MRKDLPLVEAPLGKWGERTPAVASPPPTLRSLLLSARATLLARGLPCECPTGGDLVVFFFFEQKTQDSNLGLPAYLIFMDSDK